MSRLTYLKFQAPALNGTNLSGGLVYFYEAGTSTPLDTYSDSALTVANANPVVLDARGEADIYLKYQAYKVILKDADGNEIWTEDNYLGAETGERTAPQAVTYNITSDADYTLTAAQELYGRIIITDTGTVLTTSRNIICSTSERGYYFQNDTAQTLTLKTSAGTGIAVPASGKTLLLCDGTNVIRYENNVAITGGTITGLTDLDFASAAAKQDAIDTMSQVSGASTNQVLQKDGSGNVTWTKVAQANVDNTSLNPIVQIVSSHDGAVATGTTTIPFDDTIPQNTEGDQYLSVSITPTSATNKLIIEAQLVLAASVASEIIAGLFQDSTASALAAVSTYRADTGRSILTFNYEMTSGTTSATTFKIRAGMSTAGTTTFNGAGGARRFGGVMNSFIRVTEVMQ